MSSSVWHPVPVKMDMKMMAQTVRIWFFTFTRVLLSVAVLFVFYKATVPCVVEPQLPFKDKILHALAFFVLYFLADLSFPSRRHLPGKLFWLLGYGIFIELVQFFLPWRSTELMDVVADGFGIVCCLVMMTSVRRLTGFTESDAA
jgi:VanZ family protein